MASILERYFFQVDLSLSSPGEMYLIKLKQVLIRVKFSVLKMVLFHIAAIGWISRPTQTGYKIQGSISTQKLTI